MKWLTNRFTSPLVILVILVSIALQIAWLSQLFRAQREQVKQDLERIAGEAANMSTFLSVVPGHEGNKNFKEFFLSPEWLQFKQAYNNMRFKNIGSRFNSNTAGDSTTVDISLRFFNGTVNHKMHAQVWRFDNGESITQIKKADSADASKMDSLIVSQLQKIGTKFEFYNAIFNYDNKKLISGAKQDIISSAAFRSQQYSFNLRFLNMYQLVVPSVDGIVFYRMRYYLISSILMILLTGAVFFFILRLLKNQRMYTKARLSFTSNMTHELKTPVATVALALETIMNTEKINLTAASRDYLTISRSEISRLNLMIDKVLNLDEIDNGQDRIRTELFDVQLGLKQVITSMKLQMDKANAEIIFQPLDFPCFVSGDPVHLTNVFYNLVENALKYGGSNTKLIISCTDRNNEVKISFSDNGPGIEEIYQDKIFERFFRVPEATNDIHNIKGTGLGLNYVRQIMERHNGQVSLISEAGKGSNFILHFPSVL